MTNTDIKGNFLDLLNDFVKSSSECFCGRGGLSKKKKRCFGAYKSVLEKTKTESASLKKFMDGFSSFFEKFDGSIFSENEITNISTPIYYSNTNDIYIPIGTFIEKYPEESETIRDFLLAISSLIETNEEKKAKKKKFILSRKIFGLSIDDSTPEGAFMCRWIGKARDFIPFIDLTDCKDFQSIIPVLMGLLTSGKLSEFTENMKLDWFSSGVNLPSLMRQMADVIEGMDSTRIGILTNPDAAKVLPNLLRLGSEDTKFED